LRWDLAAGACVILARDGAKPLSRFALLQRIGVARIQRPDFLMAEAALIDLDAGAKQ